MTQSAANEAQRAYLVYADNGARLVYSGADPHECEEVCRQLAARSAGHVSGYQFVGRQRFDVRAYFDQEPSALFMALRKRRDLFDFAWHPGA
ncbi:MAG TPA: hypothetical protein VFA70_08725 [Dehalococcoidia bacterium]|jgi:hypothetical protein|nr:hypothetical protein [Dehalococcoidia bacterium]